MRLPFSPDQFLDVFGAYNAAVWPVAVALWLVTTWTTVALVRGCARPRVTSAVAAIHWLWSGVVYHAIFFTTINPVAWLFAALFVLEAIALIHAGVVRHRLTFTCERSARGSIAIVFLAYSLAYPLLVILSGHQPLRAPLFAVPCPTTLFTAGLLLTARPVPVALLTVPVIWSLIGGTAAIVLHMMPDVMLFAAALSLIVYGSWPRVSTSTRSA
jgi:hypothetical protein